MCMNLVPRPSRCSLALVLAAVTTGCAFDSTSTTQPADSSESVATTEQPLAFERGMRAFEGGRIPLCWVSTDPNADWSAEKAAVKRAIGRTWLRVADLHVEWADSCDTTGTRKQVRVMLGHHRWWDPATSDWTSDNSTDGQSSMGQAALTPPGTPINDQTNGVRFWFSPKRGSVDVGLGRLQYIAVHEFGHLLGFTHEHWRTDAPEGCRPDTVDSVAVNPYDMQSIMNEVCGPLHNLNSGPLSPDDIWGVRKIYGTRKSQVGTFDPHSGGNWSFDDDGNFLPSALDGTAHYGSRYDTAVLGDWDGDGKSDVGIFNRFQGVWVLDTDSDRRWEGEGAIRFGAQGDMPVAGDWNGDGITDIGVFNPTIGKWTLDSNGDRTLDSNDRIIWFGGRNDVPVAGDWNGDGITDIGIFNASAGGVWVLDSNGNGQWDNGVDQVIYFGGAADRPVVGDWNGDGRSDIAIFNPEQRVWVLDSNGSRAFENTDAVVRGYGTQWGFPVAGNL